MAKRENKKQKMSESKKEHLQIELALKNAEMIKSSIKVAVQLNQIAGIGPEGIITSMVFVFSDFITALADSTETPKEQVMNDLFDAIRDMVNKNDDNNFKHETGN